MSEELKQQDSEQTKVAQEETVPQQENNQESSPEIKSEANKENWKKFREDREKDRLARKEAERIAEQKRAEADALKAAMDALLNNQKQQYSEQPTEEEEDEIEKRVLLALQKARQKEEAEKQKREAAELPTKLQETYRDFDKICNTENLDYLEFHYPEIATGYKHMPEGFSKWSAIYQAIKRLVPVDYKEDKKRIEENAMKPKTSLPNMTDTKPTGAPWILTEERKKANWARMQKDQRNIA